MEESQELKDIKAEKSVLGSTLLDKRAVVITLGLVDEKVSSGEGGDNI